jgi:hypothetical protein
LGKNITNHLKRLVKKEEKILSKEPKENNIKDAVYKKIPDGLTSKLEEAFTKAFQYIFLNGTSVIEKTYDKENISYEFDANNYVLDKKQSNKNLKRIDKSSKRSNLVNSSVATTAGIGLGILGMGIPDIPIFVGTILKGIYQTALSYGFSYDTVEERIYILRLIRTALSEGDIKIQYNSELESLDYSVTNLDREIAITAKVLADKMLLEKFIQGIPIIGVVGGIANHSIYKKISKFSTIKYKKRYLTKKMK